MNLLPPITTPTYSLVPYTTLFRSDLSLHSLGQSDTQHLRLASAVLPAVGRVCPELPGPDGGDRLGLLRHRKLRKMRQLHGALRLRGHGGDRYRHASAEGAQGVAQGARDGGADGAGYPARQPAAGKISVRGPEIGRGSCRAEGRRYG